MTAQPNGYNTLEELLWNDTADPLPLKLYLLKTITNGFSEEQVIGSGAYGIVYKGVLGDDFVAVKKLYSFHAIDDEPFQREVACLMRIRHHNIVWFIGYCAETCVEVVSDGTKRVFAEQREKLLCFEYLCNGSLRKHITDQPCGLQWHICYQIIKGICQGLHYLHEKHIIHLDLKPDNVLLDDSMVPKIADFGLSRLLEGKSSTITQRKPGTKGYMAPEYLDNGKITVKSDIYSLGVIIRQMVMGRGSAEATTENAQEIWRLRMEQDSSQTRHTPLKIGYRQVEACIEISKTCMEREPEKRPSTGDILRWLEKTEAGNPPIVAGATPSESKLSRLMESLQLMAEALSQPPSTRAEGSNAVVPVASSTAPTDGAGTTNPDESFWLSSRSLGITWVETPEYWKWITDPASRFAECAELLSVYFLAVIGEISSEDLTPGKRYAVYLVYKLAPPAVGLNGGQKSSVRLYGERTVATYSVSVDPAWGGAAGVACPVERGDGWMEVKLAEFAADEKMLKEKAVIVDFREENDHIKKSGLIIEGMEFRTA